MRHASVDSRDACAASRDALPCGEVHEALANFSVKLDKDAVRIIDGAHEAKFQWGTAYAGAPAWSRGDVGSGA